MPTAVVLMNVEGQQTNKIAEAISAISGVSEVYSVAGSYDLIAVVRTATNEALADLVTDGIRPIPGIMTSQTLIAFRVYSPSQVNALFDEN